MQSRQSKDEALQSVLSVMKKLLGPGAAQLLHRVLSKERLMRC